MKNLILTAMIIVGVATMAAQGQITVDSQSGVFYTVTDPAALDNPAEAFLSSESLVAWIVDMDEDGFGDFSTLGPDGFTVDDDDVVADVGSSGTAGAGTVFGTFPFSNPDDIKLKPLGLLWFDVPYTDGATGAGEAGINFGFFSGSINDNEDPLTVPDNPDTTTTFNLQTLNDGAVPGFGGNNAFLPNDTFFADYTTIPEPATMALLGLGGLAMLRRRSRKA